MLRPTRQKVIEAIEKVIFALDELKDDVAVVGGAVVTLYVDDPAAADIRPTRDVDLIFEIATQNELQMLEKKLIDKGFKHARDEHIICRFIIDDILVDVMATKEVGWAPGDLWFEEGFEYLIKHDLPNIQINILPFPYFLASKFSAFYDKGDDPRQSKHFEDIVYLIDNRTNWVSDILNAPASVKEYIVSELKILLKDDNLKEAVQAHLESATQSERFKMIMDKITEAAQ